MKEAYPEKARENANHGLHSYTLMPYPDQQSGSVFHLRRNIESRSVGRGGLL